jgi:phosphoglycerate dehydrogenase-like enzyme
VVILGDPRPSAWADRTAAWEPLKAVGDVEVYDHSSDQQAREATVLITNHVTVTADLIEQAPALRLIAVSFTGLVLEADLAEALACIANRSCGEGKE